MKTATTRKRKAKPAVAVAVSELRNDSEYETYLVKLRERFEQVTAAAPPLFTTDTPDLFNAYLDGLPTEVRQHHNCHACRRFINAYGGLVTIGENGTTESVLWELQDAPNEIADGIASLEVLVEDSRVTGVFYDNAKTWGTPVTFHKDIWSHMAVTPPKALVFKELTRTPFQASAEKREDLKNVTRAISEIPVDVLSRAITLLKSEALYRSEKLLGAAQWLWDVHQITTIKNRTMRANLMWLAIAKAPAGFCHPRSSMIGTLLDDLIAGLDFTRVSERFAEKMNPLKYQRPTAPPAAGNIAQAEKLIAQLGAAGSLARRFARLEEIEKIWEPRPKRAEPATGVFSHLNSEKSPRLGAVSIPRITMTWEKFARTVLLDAEEVQYQVPTHGHFCGIVTATDQDAPPILQWDSPERRNPFSWYVYYPGSPAARWNLQGGYFRKVTAVTYQPSAWGGGFEHQGNAAIFILEDAKDVRQGGSLCLFPEILKSEFHGVRATIEAYSKSKSITGVTEASACGIRLQKGATWDAIVRVVSRGITTDYKLDRWD
jgi:hypothetical protein